MKSFGINNIYDLGDLMYYSKLHYLSCNALREHVIPQALKGVGEVDAKNEYDESDVLMDIENISNCVASAFQQELFAAVAKRHQENEEKSYAF